MCLLITSAQRERKKGRLISERGLSAYHRDADNAASGSARDSSDAASANANVSSGRDSLGCPSPFPCRGGNALSGAPDIHPSSSCRFAPAPDNLQQFRGLIPAFLSLAIMHAALLILLVLIRSFFWH